MTTTIFDESTDTAFYLCPQCGKNIPEARIAHDLLFCSKYCLVAFKKDKPQTWGPEFANYRLWVLGDGIGRGPEGIRPKDAEGQNKQVMEWPDSPGPLLDAFHRVHDLGVFLGDRAKKEGREPFVSGGERMVRLNRLAKQPLKP